MPGRLILSALLLVSTLAAQSAPGVSNLLLCDDRNGTTDVTEGTVVLPSTATGPMGLPSEVAIRVVPSQALTLEGVEILISSMLLVPGLPPLGIFTVYDEDPATGLPGMPVGNSGNVTAATPLANGLQWTAGAFQPPVMLSSGTAYWISYFDLFGAGITYGTQNVSGPDVTLYSTGGLVSGVAWSPAQSNERLKLRLLSSTCPLPSNAAVSVVGFGCPPGSAPTLLTSGLPITGNNNFGFLINSGFSGLPAALFWAPAADPVGTIVATGSCTLFLDLPGTLALINAGLNPIGVGQTGLTGIASFPFPIPQNPALDGFSAAFQGVLVDPNGAPTGTPGLSIALTPAVVATIGL